MDTILIFVVLPLATIIFSIALQKLLKCPILVAGIAFAIFLILAYTVFGIGFIIAAIVYTLLAFVTAFLTCLICRLIRRLRDLENRNSDCDSDDNCYSCLTISTGGTSGNNYNNSNNCDCGCNSNNNNNNNNDSIVVNAEIVPTNNGRSGCFRGAFRRRC